MSIALLQKCAFAGALLAATITVPPAARADGGRYTFAGGTPREQAEVRRALEASSFDWSIVPARVTIHIARGAASRATRGEIWLDADLLDAGQFAWGVVQHEYAHQVDFFVLMPADRATLSRELDAEAWCDDSAERRAELGCERFASALAWAYWPTALNCMRPAGWRAAAAARFRNLVSNLLEVNR
jgi:hypothetical protein